MNIVDVAGEGGAVRLAGARIPVPVQGAARMGLRPEHATVVEPGAGTGAIVAEVTTRETLGGDAYLYARLEDGQQVVAPRRRGHGPARGRPHRDRPAARAAAPLRRRRAHARLGRGGDVSAALDAAVARSSSVAEVAVGAGGAGARGRRVRPQLRRAHRLPDRGPGGLGGGGRRDGRRARGGGDRHAAPRPARRAAPQARRRPRRGAARGARARTTPCPSPWAPG